MLCQLHLCKVAQILIEGNSSELTSQEATPPPLPATPHHEEKKITKEPLLALVSSCWFILALKLHLSIEMFYDLKDLKYQNLIWGPLKSFPEMTSDKCQHLCCCLGQKVLLFDLFIADLQ